MQEQKLVNIGGTSTNGINFAGEFTNYTDLSTNEPAGVAGRFAFVLNSQGTKWLPSSLGGTFYGAGWYYDTGSQWSNKNDEIYKGIEDLISSNVQTVTGDGVDNTDPQNPVLSFPDADNVNDSLTSNKFVKKIYINLDSSETSISRNVSGGRTTFTINHNLNTKDIVAIIYRLSDDRRINWRIESPTVNSLEVSRAGNVADNLFRILIIT